MLKNAQSKGKLYVSYEGVLFTDAHVKIKHRVQVRLEAVFSGSTYFLMAIMQRSA